MAEDKFNRTTEYIGRLVKNGFGKLETVTLPKGYWEYFDWCVQQGWDMDEWTMYQDYDRLPDDSFSEKIHFEFWRLLCSRHKQGLLCPPNCPPDGYDDFLEDIESGKYSEILPNDSDINNMGERVSKPLITASDQVEIVSLPRRHWLHFEWLYIHGRDMEAWVKKLDLERHTYEGFRITLERYLEMALVMDEANRHRAGEDVPLFINPHRCVD